MSPTINQIIGSTPNNPTVTTDQAPLAHFSAAPTQAVISQPVTFNASSSVSPVGTTNNQLLGIYSYTWDFGDGSPDITTTNPVITHSYTSVGTEQLNLQ